MDVIVDPNDVHVKPFVEFYGDEEVQALRQWMREYTWDSNSSLRTNIENAFGVPLPREDCLAARPDDASEECPICYCTELELAPGKVEVLSAICMKCKKGYHPSCIREYLDTGIADCPNCYEPFVYATNPS